MTSATVELLSVLVPLVVTGWGSLLVFQFLRGLAGE